MNKKTRSLVGTVLEVGIGTKATALVGAGLLLSQNLTLVEET